MLYSIRRSKRAKGALSQLRRRLEESRRSRMSGSERPLVERVRAARDALATVIGPATACSRCQVQCSIAPEVTDKPGGLCCEGAVQDVFSPEEIHLLAALGCRARDLQLPARPREKGCLFRGEAGCSLPASARPSICVHYICRDLMAELAERGVAARAADLQSELERAMKDYLRAWQSQREEADWAATVGQQ